MEIIANLPLKNSLLKHAVFHDLKQTIIDKITSTIPEVQKIRLNHELTEIICNVVENLSDSTNESDKRALAYDILEHIFHFNENEKTVILEQIQYTYDNNLIIRISFVKRYYRYAVDWFRKKFL
jgi:squalene cyclase